MFGKNLLWRVPKRGIKWTASTKEPKKAPQIISVTGASGHIAYALLPRLAKGELLGKDQPLILKLIDLPDQQEALAGVKMELEDLASPVIHEIITTSSLSTGFENTDFAFLIGSKPQEIGMERSELVEVNTKVFVDVGKALNDHANRNCKMVVVGNPANTNCHTAQTHAPNLPPENFTAMTMLDHLRAIYQLSNKLGVNVQDIERFCSWGNHGPTMFPDCRYLMVKGRPYFDKLDKKWLENEFIPKVRKRWKDIQDARNLTSIASPAHAALEHMKAWVHGTDGAWVSFAVVSKGEYEVAPGLVYSYPVTCKNGKWNIVVGLDVPPEDARYLKTTEEELEKEAKKADKISAGAPANK